MFRKIISRTVLLAVLGGSLLYFTGGEKLDHMLSMARNMATEITHLRDSNKDKSAEAANYENELNKTKEELNKNKEELAKTKDSLDRAIKESELNEGTIQGQSQKISDLKSKVAELEHRQKELTKTISGYIKMYEQQKKDILARANNEIDKANEKVDSTYSEMKQVYRNVMEKDTTAQAGQSSQGQQQGQNNNQVPEGPKAYSESREQEPTTTTNTNELKANYLKTQGFNIRTTTSATTGEVKYIADGPGGTILVGSPTDKNVYPSDLSAYANAN